MVVKGTIFPLLGPIVGIYLPPASPPSMFRSRHHVKARKDGLNLSGEEMDALHQRLKQLLKPAWQL